ncbi:energy transducer TonB [Paraferrimonas sp. SM1919]|uniref:energy transducer TonB n=1 Tax=Paraferrimonas sp. SM1919 TaxID=2662263 RepID=UPI0013D7CDAD|nr:energy transducer TonB [Paraferrimonas sp. SM1919]
MIRHIYRLPSTMLMAAFISFGLFVLMAQLISNPVATVTTAIPTPNIVVTFEPNEIPPETKRNITPPPKPVTQPQTQPPQIKDSDPIIDTVVPVVATPIIPTTLNPSEAGINKQATPVFRIEPQYPIKALSRGIEGYVDLYFDVDQLGQTHNIRVIAAKPKRVFDSAAIKALKKWRYQPQMIEGKPIAQSGLQVRLEFNLND